MRAPTSSTTVPSGQSADLDGDLEKFIIRNHAFLDDLQDKVNTLPIINSEGSSECPFADRLYFQANEKLSKAVFLLPIAKEYLPKIEQELSRRSRDLGTIRSNEGRLRLRESREQFQEAARHQKGYHEHLKGLQERLLALIKRMKEVIERGNSRMAVWKRTRGNRDPESPDGGSPSPGPPIGGSFGLPDPPAAPGEIGNPPPVLSPSPDHAERQGKREASS